MIKKTNAKLEFTDGSHIHIPIQDGPGKGRLGLIQSGYGQIGVSTVPRTSWHTGYASSSYPIYGYTKFSVGIEISRKGKRFEPDLGLYQDPDGHLFVRQVTEATLYSSRVEAGVAANRWIAEGGKGVILEILSETTARKKAEASALQYLSVLSMMRKLMDEDIRKLIEAGEAVIAARAAKPAPKPKPPSKKKAKV